MGDLWAESAAGYRIKGPETWARARADYEAGESGPDVCERHGLGLSAMRVHARREGWRRCDQLEAEADDADDGAAPAMMPRELVDEAWRRLSLAVRRNRLREALQWTRLHKALRTLATDLEDEKERRASGEWLSARFRQAGEQAQAELDADVRAQALAEAQRRERAEARRLERAASPSDDTFSPKPPHDVHHVHHIAPPEPASAPDAQPIADPPVLDEDAWPVHDLHDLHDVHADTSQRCAAGPAASQPASAQDRGPRIRTFDLDGPPFRRPPDR